MGLDMYLEAEKFVAGYDFRGDQEKDEYRKLIDLVGAEPFASTDTPTLTVTVTVGYWRKANAIHAWFVREVQDGEDNCQPHYVAREQLRELRYVCTRILQSTRLIEGRVYAGTVYGPNGTCEAKYEPGKVLEDPSVAQELLPTQAGFFFGGTEYDEWYWRDLESTVAQIDQALRAPDDWGFEYRSSW